MPILRYALSLVAAVAAFAGSVGKATFVAPPEGSSGSHGAAMDSSPNRVRYKTVKVNNLEVFYREAGPKDAPAILLLHGFPSSSSMFRDLIPALADKYHVVAPDYPGYGRSSQPPVSEFSYTFDGLAGTIDAFTRQVGLTKFTMYVQDYGAPVGYRIATAHPDRISGIIVQNGNAYVEGLPDGFWAPLKEFWKDPTPELRTKLEAFLTLESTKWQYLHGARDPQNISPDAYLADQAVLDRPGNKDVQIALFKDYGSNPPLYPAWQDYFRKHQPPMLIVWGKNDQIFPAAGAEPYKRDLKNLDFNLLDTGHFALEEEGDLIAVKIRTFMEERVAGRPSLIPAPRQGFDAGVISKHSGYDEAAVRAAFKHAVPVKTVVVYCFDPRCQRVPEVLARVMPGEVYPGEIIRDAGGSKVGSTRTIMPVVVAGGRAVDALRSITVASHLFGFQNLVVVHHTNCGGTTFTADGITRAFQREQGADISRAYNRRDIAITDFNTSLRDDIQLLRESPGVPRNVNIYGYVYNTDTDQMTLVREDLATASAATK